MAHGIIEATYSVTTPLFCAGADQGSAELRLPSFKGVLRFWWRALAWPRLAGDLHGELGARRLPRSGSERLPERALLERVKAEEAALFGSAAGGQSRVVLRMDGGGAPRALSKDQVLQSGGKLIGPGARYLGYGVMGAFGASAGKLTRACLEAPFDFRVHLRCRGLERGQVEALTEALICLGTLGGMGARSRKGYGSLAIRSLRVDGEEQWKQPRSASELAAAVGHFRQLGHSGSLPAYTAMSAEARCLVVGPKSGGVRSTLALLDLIGREMMRYRSWGHNARVLGGPSEKNFKDDHDLMKERGPKHGHPRRVAFGLPHNYGRGPWKQVGPADSNLDRRASPLFIHIHEYGDTPVAVLSFLPARFLPGCRPNISVGGHVVPQRPEDELYLPIHAFLNRLLDPNECKEPLRAREVSP